MPSPFQQTRSALEADRSRSSLLGAVAAILALAVWGFAFFSGRPVYEISFQARVEKGTAGVQVAARFEDERAFRRIRSGQRAWVTLSEGARLEATVYAVSGNGSRRVELALVDEEAATRLGSPGGPEPEAVAVEVERASPARRALRASGGR